MALILADRVKETSTTTGNGVFTLAGATTGFQSFAVIGNTNTTFYCIAGQGTSEWEVGIGTYASAGTTLTRTTVLSNSSATEPSALSFAAGTKDVFVTYPSEKSVNLDASGNATALGTPVAFTGTNITGTATSFTASNVTTNANLTGEATSSGSNAVTLTNSAVIGKVITGYVSGAGAVAATDTLLQAIQKLNGNTAAVVGGAALSNDTTTATSVYPVFAAATTGTPTTIYTSNSKLLYKPSTGELAVTAPIAANGLVLNANTVATSYTIAAGFNAHSVGPITVNGGVVVTITAGQRWLVS